MSSTPLRESDPTGVFFWARSGGGHRTAKEGIKQQKIKEYAARGSTLDTSHDIEITGEKVLSSVQLPFVGGLGDLGANAWEEAQRKGDLKFLNTVAHLGWIGEIIFYPLVYFKVKWLLQDLKVQPDFVVSTQAFCLNAIMRAMQSVNKQKNWNMKMDVYLTDMPSKKAVHFFPSIRKVTADKELKGMLTLHAPPPLPKAGQTAQAFWKKQCGDITVITNEQFPIREAFLETGTLKERLQKPVVDVHLKLNHPSEAEMMRSVNRATVDDKKVTLKVHTADTVTFLMLGSQPTTDSVLSWLNTFVSSSNKATARQTNERQNYFFLYCGTPHTENARNPLLDAVSEKLDALKKTGKLPPYCSIIPFTNQNAEEIALLMARSDVSITRSGGATSMELLQLHKADLPKRPNKLTLLHSEAMQSKKESHPLKERSDFINTITHAIAKQVDKNVPLDSPEWGSIKQEMITFCKQLGYSASKSKRIVDNVLRLYLYEEGADLKELFHSLQKQKELTSKMAVSEAEKIDAKMEKMRQKSKYQSMKLSSLRQLAIENVLAKEGMILWEASNAKYLQKEIGAHIVTPQYAKKWLTQSLYTS